MKSKKAISAWIWILIILIITGIILYFALTGSDSGGSSIFGGNSIPTPPPLPD